MARPRSEFTGWISKKPCIACGSPGAYHEETGEWLTNPAHIKSRGAGGKDEGNCVPFCHRCHRMQHDKGFDYIQELYDFSVWLEAKRLEMEYRRERAVDEVE